MDKEDRTEDREGLPLETIATLSPERIRRLKALWITTVEGLVSRSSTEDGQKGLCLLMELQIDEFHQVLADAKRLLPDDVLKDLEKPRELPPTGLLFEEDHN